MAAYNDIISNILAAIPQLYNPSQTSIFDKIAQAVGITIDNTIAELDNTKKIIDNSISTQRFGRSGYYTDKAKAFQYGDSLIIDPVTLDYTYATIDETKQIVKQAAFSLAGNELTLKIAKVDTNTNKLTKLDNTEKAAFDAYFEQFEIIGLPVSKTTNDPNELGFIATVTYYGTTSLTEITVNVEASLTDFRDNYVFDGVFYVNDLENYLRNNVVGIRDVSLQNTAIDSVAFSNSTVLSAGYFDYITDIENGITYVSI